MWLANSRSDPIVPFLGRPMRCCRPSKRAGHRALRPRLQGLEERTLLSTWTVTNNRDNPTDSGSLRYAILHAPSGTTIDFAPSVAKTITLSGGVLDIKKNLDIEGPGARRLTIDGNNASTVFNIAVGVTVTIAGLTIDHGSGVFAGGIDNQGTLSVSDSTLSDNVSSGSGGGIENNGLALSVTNCTFAGNSAGSSGGGIDNGGTLTLVNSTLSGNSAGFNGGGINSSGALLVIDSTVSQNKSLRSGGGIQCETPARLANTIIAGNTVTASSSSGPDVSGTVASLGHNLLGNTTGSSGWVSTDLLDVNPLLGSLTNNGSPTPTMALLPGSPAIDSGSASITGFTVPKLDQRGAIRGAAGLNAGAAPDIGAFEASSSYLVTTAADSRAVGTLRDGAFWAFFNTNNNPANLDPDRAAPNTIVFDTNGVFYRPQTITLSRVLGTLDLLSQTTPVAIEGPGASIVTVSGDHELPVFDVGLGARATIKGLTISHGSGAFGGGIRNLGTLTLASSFVTNNRAINGSGIYSDGTLTVADSTIAHNTGDEDVFTPQGGGIYNKKGKLTVTDSTVLDNSAVAGGGVHNGPDGTATFTNSTLANNTATFTNSTLANNHAKEDGGGIDSQGALTLINCTVAGNRAQNGGGVFHEGASGPVVLANTIVADNGLTEPGGSGPDVRGAAMSLGHNLVGKTEGGSGWISSDLLNVDPRLGPLANNGSPNLNIALMASSPAIGAGDLTWITNPPFPGPPFTDQRGFPRITNGKVDIGAFQTQ
jgi:hypothetical protein